jgi:hypothetical protein
MAVVVPHALVPAPDSTNYWIVAPPTSQFERTYYNWFRVSPTLLFETIIREGVSDHVRRVVLNHGERDPTLNYDSVDEDFYSAMVGVLDP